MLRKRKEGPLFDAGRDCRGLSRRRRRTPDNQTNRNYIFSRSLLFNIFIQCAEHAAAVIPPAPVQRRKTGKSGSALEDFRADDGQVFRYAQPVHPRGIRHAGRNRVVCADDGSYLRMPFQQRIRQLFAQLVRRSLIRVPYEDGQVGALPDFSGGAQEGFSPGGVPASPT